MPELPPLTIVATTWFPDGEDGDVRLQTFKDTLSSWHEHIKYGGELQLHIADDGSNPRSFVIETPPLWRTSVSSQQRRGVGASLNAGIFQARKNSSLILYAVDDWQLTGPLDLNPWAHLLLGANWLGCVRLGPPHPDLTGRVQHLGPLGWALMLDRHHYAFGFRPALYHERFFEAYGPFEEGVSSLECERVYNERVAAAQGPDIALALFTPFDHLYGVELSAVVPT